MLSKNKLNRLDEDKNIAKDKDKDKTKDNDKTKDKDKTKTKIMINNKMDFMNEIGKRLAKAKTKLTNKIEPLYKAMRKLPDDSWLRLAELNKIDAILDDAIDVVEYEIYGKNRKSPEMNKNIK